jgi:hypothetical protein
VKTLNLAVSTMAVVRCYLLGCVVVELRSPWSRFGGKSQLFLYLLYLSLITFVGGSPHHLVSVWLCLALFIKRGESLFQKED